MSKRLEVVTPNGRNYCTASLGVPGGHVYCDLPPGHGSRHRNANADFVWTETESGELS